MPAMITLGHLLMVLAALALLAALVLLPSFRVHWEHPAFALGHPGETAESP